MTDNSEYILVDVQEYNGLDEWDISEIIQRPERYPQFKVSLKEDILKIKNSADDSNTYARYKFYRASAHVVRL